MNEELCEKFFTAILRFKKLEAVFSTKCEIPMNELAILQTITGCAGDRGCGGVNLDVPDIQERLQISKPAVSYILNTLEKKQYITRQIDARDRRKIFITATPAGVAAAAESSQKRDELWELLLGHFGEEELRHLLEQIGRLTEMHLR